MGFVGGWQMQILLLLALLVGWIYLMAPEAKANLAPFDPSDPRFNQAPEDKAAPGDKPADGKTKKQAPEKKKTDKDKDKESGKGKQKST